MTDKKHMSSVGPNGKKHSGNVSQLINRYETLAKDEQDSIKAEQYGQHAEHYRRLKMKRK